MMIFKTPKYYNIGNFKEMKFHKNNEKFPLMHMNISSLPYPFDYFQQLLVNLETDFDIMCIAESRMKNKKVSLKI